MHCCCIRATSSKPLSLVRDVNISNAQNNRDLQDVWTGSTTWHVQASADLIASMRSIARYSPGPTTFEGISRSLKSAQEAIATPEVARTPQNPTGATAPEASRHAGDLAGAEDGRSPAERQPQGALESALSRLGGMLESAGPSVDHPCSQFEAPAGMPCRCLTYLCIIYVHHSLQFRLGPKKPEVVRKCTQIDTSFGHLRIVAKIPMHR